MSTTGVGTYMSKAEHNRTLYTDQKSQGSVEKAVWKLLGRLNLTTLG